MFKAKCVISKDKDRKPYQFRAKKFYFLAYIASILLIIWSIISVFVTSSLSLVYALFGVFLFLILLLLASKMENYSLTVRLDSLIYDSAKNNSFTFYLPLTKVEYKGHYTTLSEGGKEVQIPYISKEIDDALVQFLNEIGVTDQSQKKEEEPS